MLEFKGKGILDGAQFTCKGSRHIMEMAEDF